MKRFAIFSFTAITFLIFQDTSAQENMNDWYNDDFNLNISRGISSDYLYSVVDSTKLEPVIVAVIDNGVDVFHEDLQGSIWLNKNEIADNNIDDDKNGYVDDIYGWNYLGNPSGENIDKANLEITRLYRTYSERFENVNVDTLKGDDITLFADYKSIQKSFEEKASEIRRQFEEYSQLAAIYKGSVEYMKEKLGSRDLSVNELLTYKPESKEDEQIIQFLLMAKKEGLQDYLNEGESYFDSALNYHYNIDFNPREIVNEDLLENEGLMYGNNQVWASKPDHGTHVAGIIAANRSNDIGVSGIAANARIMVLRAVPDGDERDEDIAHAIRYATDNGADIINMSFGKGYSPKSEMVEAAIDYALSKDILLVHAAGNEGANIDEDLHYPRGLRKNKKSKKGFLTVGAHTRRDSVYLLASFSNYGKKSVDVLAPGEDINSTVSGNEYRENSGTSMAAPVVSGLVAVYRGLYPEKNANQIKKLLLKSRVEKKNLDTKLEDLDNPLKDLVRYPGFIDAREILE